MEFAFGGGCATSLEATWLHDLELRAALAKPFCQDLLRCVGLENMGTAPPARALPESICPEVVAELASHVPQCGADLLRSWSLLLEEAALPAWRLCVRRSFLEHVFQNLPERFFGKGPRQDSD